MSIYEGKLNKDSLLLLAQGKIDVLVSNDYIKSKTCAKLSAKLLESGYDPYVNASSIGRVGMALYEAENDPSLLEEYYSSAVNNIVKIRNTFHPYVSPIDHLRCQLEELWPSGAKLENFHGKKVFVGLARVVEPNITFLAHHDIVEKDVPNSYDAKSIQAQLAANIHLQVPKVGGDLILWHKKICPDEFDSMRGDSYGVSPETLGKPDIVVKPKAGQLIIFNSRKMHSVNPGQDIPRLSLSCFIAYRGTHQPLTYWS